jgi:hypothetical protein
MKSALMWWPAVAMAVLTFVVWLRMYFMRVGEMKRQRVHPQAVALSAQMAERLKDTREADNFRNLFELPVLFYLALAMAVQTAQVSAMTLALAWAFVAFRVIHSAIHCSYNKVYHRFYAYFAGGFVLWVLWAVLAFGLMR